MPALVQHLTWGTGDAAANEDKDQDKPTAAALCTYCQLCKTYAQHGASFGPGSRGSHRREFGPGILVDALQLATREALDDCIPRSHLGTSTASASHRVRIAPRPPLLYPFKGLRDHKKDVRNVE
ncbi:hypothetical protein DL764_010919 [Monosporascus ibericus]|uniref:Uncharacterized protein n=1 Tax=Monosporascus ibericus TaxID=155417 RepID=A0A4Q4SRT9_9PEZI|nr:hypothetical protein DL764_010919 [Monosporascus ibericus]